MPSCERHIFLQTMKLFYNHSHKNLITACQSGRLMRNSSFSWFMLLFQFGLAIYSNNKQFLFLTTFSIKYDVTFAWDNVLLLNIR